MGFGVVGPQRDRSLESDDGLVDPARVLQGVAQVVVRIGIIGPQRDGPAAGINRLGVPAELPQGIPQIAMGLGMVGHKRNCALEADDRPFFLPRSAVRLAQVVVIGTSVRVDRDGPANQVNRRTHRTDLSGHDAE